MTKASELPPDYYSKRVPDFTGAAKPIGFRSVSLSVPMRESGVVFEVDCRDRQENSVIDLEDLMSLHAERAFDQDHLEMGVQVAANDGDMPIVVFHNTEVGRWLYGCVVADPPIQVLLCRLMDENAIEIEGPYEDGTVLLYARDFGLKDMVMGALMMRELLPDADGLHAEKGDS